MAVTSNKNEIADLLSASAEIKGRSLWQDAWARFMHNKAAIAGVIGLGLITLFAIFTPFLSTYTLDGLDYDYIQEGPSLSNGHWFGTDANGRDLLVRTAYGARISLLIGLMTTAIALSIGVLYGTLAGFLGGHIDNIMMRFVDVLYALPLIFFIIILVTIVGRNIFLVFIGIGAVEWLTMARIVRGQTLSVKQKEYVEAAIVAGVSPAGIIKRHIIPNVIGPVVVFVTLLIPTNILIESYLSFLGLGVQEPMTSWGVLIKQGSNNLESMPWLLLFPATFLAVTMFCFNFIGDGLRDALDPKDR